MDLYDKKWIEHINFMSKSWTSRIEIKLSNSFICFMTIKNALKVP